MVALSICIANTFHCNVQFTFVVEPVPLFRPVTPGSPFGSFQFLCTINANTLSARFCVFGCNFLSLLLPLLLLVVVVASLLLYFVSFLFAFHVTNLQTTNWLHNQDLKLVETNGYEEKRIKMRATDRELVGKSWGNCYASALIWSRIFKMHFNISNISSLSISFRFCHRHRYTPHLHMNSTRVNCSCLVHIWRSGFFFALSLSLSSHFYIWSLKLKYTLVFTYKCIAIQLHYTRDWSNHWLA